MRNIFILLTLAIFGHASFAQTTINRDPEIDKMVKEISRIL